MIAKLTLLGAIVVLGAYVLPSAVATFAGSHTMEWNASANITGLKCGECHQYIVNELNATGVRKTENVIQSHLDAISDSNYTTWLLGKSFGTVTQISEVCQLCHYTNVTISGAHTKVIIRPCTEADCHGNATNANAYNAITSGSLKTAVSSAYLNIGPTLASSTDKHSKWFTGLTGDSGYKRYRQGVDTGTNYTVDYYACLGCHTHVGVNFNITRPNSYNLNVSALDTFAVSTTINYTTRSTNYSTAVAGSKWK